MFKDNVSVLLIEDDEIDVMGVKRAFAQSNMNNSIVVAANGIEALAKLRDLQSIQKPYMVLLDLNMPCMNGIEFLKEARNDPDLQSLIVFVLTTSRTEEDKRKAYHHNIAGYIVKDGEGNKGGFIDAAHLLQQYTRVIEFP